MPHPPGYGLAARLAAIGLGLAPITLGLPAQATPVTWQTAPLTAPLVIADPQPVATAVPTPGAAPRPIADPPGTESLWFVGVFQ